MSMLHSSNKLKQVRNSIALGSEVALAVRRALMLGAVAAAGSSVVSMPAHAQEQTTAAAGEEAPTQTVTITGSRIRRVDTETASPVYTIDQSAIQQSGVSTIGELIMQLPSVAGAATNPSVNNGGGFGESYVELRGLDAKRTVVLVDGRRLGLIGDPGSGTSAVDVNQIPLAIIDHVEVLKEGAGAVYGSDAIAGVVNFITRKDVQGLEINADYGRTTHGDAAHHQVNLTIGEQSDKFSFMLSGRYQKQDSLLESRRTFSQFAMYNSSGSIYAGGSSRTPTGRIYDPTFAATLGCPKSSRGSVTKISGDAGNALSSYRCFNNGGTNDDHYNYAPLNYLMTPQERGSIFGKANYKINDDFETYTEVLYNRTHSGFQEASLPFDAQADNVVISKNSIYNPFNIDFGGIAAVNPEAQWRLLGLGPRRSDTVSASEVANVGLRGNILSTGWQFDLNLMYGRIDQHANIQGYFFGNLLQNAVGPSFLDGNNNNTPTCGTPANPIANCTPIDLFDVNDPKSTTAAQQLAFSQIATGYNIDHTYDVKTFALDTNGKLFTLPAGDLQASAGIEHKWQEGRLTADQIVIAQPPLFLQCEISQETCTGPERLSYSNTDIYGELFAPLLKDLPAVKSLNVDLGVRWSNYTMFSAVTKGQIKVEYKPVADLLVRSTFSQIYRVPTIQDLAQAPAINSPTYRDPCANLDPTFFAANQNYHNLCSGVIPDGKFSEPNGQVTGELRSNPNLKPETGEVFTYGLVYDSSFIPDLSASLDFWRYTINDVLTQLDPAFSDTQCLASGSPFYCSLGVRYPATSASPGQIQVYLQPTENLGTLKTDGVDIGLKYALRHTPIGSFRFSIDTTHVNSFTNNPGGVAPATVQYAGTYSRQFGNDAKWRGLASISWGFRGFEALLTEQYIGKLIIPNGSPNPNPGQSPDIAIPAVEYTNFSLGYNFPTNTRVMAGVENAFNRQPPIFYQNNVTNANTDVSTYDVLGRRWFVSFTQKF
jgi:outer membrane receptor protein involved in Fe transport